MKNTLGPLGVKKNFILSIESRILQTISNGIIFNVIAQILIV
jgi:hypothetical protein